MQIVLIEYRAEDVSEDNPQVYNIMIGVSAVFQVFPQNL